MLEIIVTLKGKIMIRSGHTRSDHNFAHVTTAELSWHVQISDLLGIFKIKSDNFREISIMNSKTLCEVGHGKTCWQCTRSCRRPLQYTKFVSNSNIKTQNFTKSGLVFAPLSAVQSLKNFAHVKEGMHPVPVQNFGMILQLKWILWVNTISKYTS